jgi:hypothetical protein
MIDGFTKLPQNLPIPLDDGASFHLLGKSLPNVILDSTALSIN